MKLRLSINLLKAPSSFKFLLIRVEAIKKSLKSPSKSFISACWYSNASSSKIHLKAPVK